MKIKTHITALPCANVVKIDCNLLCGNVRITSTDGDKLIIERVRHSHIKISENGGAVKIKQIRKPFFHKAAVDIYVPANLLPDINVNVKSGNIEIADGAFRDLNTDCGDAEMRVYNSTFNKADVSCKNLKLDCADVKVESSFICAADSGEVIAENSLCTKIDMTITNGNMGITGLKCRDGAFTVQEGSINVILFGAEDEYSLDLISANGTCNKENVCGGAYALKAYTGSGNIVVDFDNVCSEPQADIARGA